MRMLVALLMFHALAAASPVIDDRGLRTKLQEKLAAVAEREEHVTGEDLAEEVKEARDSKPLEATSSTKSDGVMKYDEEVNGVVMIGSVYKCSKCDKWHLGGVASGWILTADGLMVTNYHVFEDADRETYGVMTLDGKFGEITGVVAADKAADIAVFRVKGEGFAALPLAEKVEVGEGLHVISHPDGRYFTYTAGRVSRLYRRGGRGRPSTWMAITADYAHGSSGGPVFNDRGEVIGMVSSTNTIHYSGQAKEGEKREPGPAQMVIKDCVSLAELKRLLASGGKIEESGE